jgi:outer membrane protein OmpA-like peptidoglycan-associated protein
MRILSAVLVLLLLACLGGAAYFYTNMYQPMIADVDALKSGKIELEKSRIELKKYRDQEVVDRGWIKAAQDIFSGGLADEIKAGTAEVVVAGNKLVVNIAEQALYTPGSKTFAKNSQQLLLKLDSLLRSDAIKEKHVLIGNTTQTAPAQTIGRKKVPAKDPRALSLERSMELIKNLEKKGVNQNTLVAAAYGAKQPDGGFSIKDRKTMIIIENISAASAIATKPTVTAAAQSKPTSTAQPTTTTKPTTTTPTAVQSKPTTTVKSFVPAEQTNVTTTQTQSKQTSTVKPVSAATSTASTSSQPQPKPIPIRPAQPKTN